jgi:cytochrome c-type biogenesis protein CcmF
MIGLVSRSHRRYGGYIVHLGIVLMFLGFAGEGYKREEQVLLRPGASATVREFTVTHRSVKVTDDGQKQMVTAHVDILRDGAAIGAMDPAKWFFRKREQEPTTEVAIARRVGKTCHRARRLRVAGPVRTLHIVVNPLVNWIWVGFGILPMAP